MTKSKTKAAEARAVSLLEAARLLGKHRNTVSTWLAQGAPYVSAPRDGKNGDAWRLDLAALFDWHARRAVQAERERLEKRHAREVERLRAALGQAEGAGPVPTSRAEALRRRAVAEALIKEADAEERAGRCAPVDALRDFVINLFVAVRTRIEAIPAKTAQRLAGERKPAACFSILDTEVRETLEAIADSASDDLVERTVEVGQREARKR